MKYSKDGVPTYESMFNPTLQALHKLGGSASIQELVEQIVDDLDLPSEIIDMPHSKGNQTKIEYRCAWARTYLKNYGLIENSERGVWALTAKGKTTKKVNEKEVVKAVRSKPKKTRAVQNLAADHDDMVEPWEEDGWRAELIQILHEMDPSAFERLCQRLLRESGFIEVEVTGRSGDGGIDGHGTIRIGGLVSFSVIFQSKRHKNNIGAEVVRDFRGAMIGRADKGLIITTGGFTREARKEATRDGAPPIDLMDGELLMDKLKELRLGVNVEKVENVLIDSSWLKSI